MAGKMWCCGGGSSSGGGSGDGLAAVTVQDTPTVDLEGDGTAGNALLATVNLAAEPNALEVAPDGLLVAPSADAGNGLTLGSDGRLYAAAAAGGAVDVQGVTGSAPTPVDPAGARSVDVDVAEGPPGTFSVGARLSPVWGEIGPLNLSGTDLTHPINTATSMPGASFTAPEPGIYEVTAKISAQVRDSAPSPAPHLVEMFGYLRRNGTILGTGYVLSNYWYEVAGTRLLSNAGTLTLTQRVQLAAGDTTDIGFTWWATGTVAAPDGSHGSFSINASLGYHKISD
ncbi:hypothetical protein RKD35_002825 [Streptomyces albogriseolus]